MGAQLALEKSTEILQRINGFIDDMKKGGRVSELILRRATNDAKALSKVPGASSIGKAIGARIEALKVNVEAFDRLAGEAMQQRLDQVLGHVIADSAKWLGKFDLAYKCMRTLANAHMSIPDVNRVAILGQMGRFIEASEIAAASGDFSKTWFINPSVVKDAATYLKHVKLTDDDVSQRASVATRVVAEATGRPVLAARLRPSDFGIFFEFPYYGSIEDAIEVDWKILEALNEAFEDTLSDHISFITYHYPSSEAAAMKALA